MFRVAAASGLCLAIGIGAAWAEGDYDRGKKLAKEWECTKCHGLTGNERSVDPPFVPMLAGQPAGYLVKTLNEYKSGARIDEHIWSKMSMRAAALSDQDIEDIAAYFSAQKRY